MERELSLSVGAVRGASSGDPEGHGEEGSGDRHHPMGVHSPGTLRDSCKGALETGHLSLSMEALLGEPGVGAPLLGALKVTKGRLWGWASLFMGFSQATWSGLICWGLQDMVERGSGGGVPSLWELCEGNLEGGLPCWGP